MPGILVIPSNRPEQLRAFFDAWDGRGGWDHVIVVEDGPRRSFRLADDVTHVSWREIEQDLGRDAWIVSRRDSAIRCYGFWLAWRMGARHVLTLDDDTRPLGETPLLEAHRAALEGHRRWVESIPGLRTRGLPYRTLGRVERVVMSMGLWADVPDQDAPAALLHPVRGFTPPAGTRLIPAGQYVPVCGMNLCVTREAIPLCYFPPMGDGWPYRRFDDIWMGVVAKRVLDRLGWHLSVGEPHVRHVRASDPFRNLVAEAPGIAANESFWEEIDAAPLAGHTPLDCLIDVAYHLERSADTYRRQLAAALLRWTSLFE